jgi:mannose-6-phosphate isomerase-like protein (cupin superfamily)
MSSWYFAYGPSTSPESFTAAFPDTAGAVRPARLAGHRLLFATSAPGQATGTTAIAASDGSTVLGTAYEVPEEALARIAAAESGKRLMAVTIDVDGDRRAAHALVPQALGPAAAPSDTYLAQVREGLSYFYPVTAVHDYLSQVLSRKTLFNDILLQRAEDAVYSDEYNCRFRRLYPWKGKVRTPWGSAIGIVEPGTATAPHSHDEEETMMVLEGEGELTLGGCITQVKRGDVVFLQPFAEHTVRNTAAAADLELLFIWWGGEEGEAAQRRVHG